MKNKYKKGWVNAPYAVHIIGDKKTMKNAKKIKTPKKIKPLTPKDASDFMKRDCERIKRKIIKRIIDHWKEYLNCSRSDSTLGLKG